ncbi:MAG: glycosyltransferase family 2 protein [Nitrospirota bacterium]
MNKNICAVIVSYNSPDRLSECISSILPQADEIIVIDNSSDARARQRIKELTSSQKMTLVLNENNEGLGHALNQGLRRSAERGYIWTLLLDDDSILSDSMIDEMMRSYSNCGTDIRGAVAAIVPAVYDKKLDEYIPSVITTKTFNRKLRQPPSDAFVHFHITSGTLLKNETLERVGYMNERLFIDYIDFDYCFRLLNKGYKILLSKDALLYHSLGELRQTLFLRFREHNFMRVYYQSRNRLYALIKHGVTYKSFLFAESFRFASKLFKIIMLESNKAEKIHMYFKGIKDCIRDYKNLDAEF